MNPPNPTRPPLLSVPAALEHLLAAAIPLPEVEIVDTLVANGRVLAVTVCSALDVPPMDNSQMDGYAVCRQDLVACASGIGVRLPVGQRIAAGQIGQALQPGTAARIFTGAMMPDGADAVVMQEQCEVLEAGATIQINHLPQVGEWVRKRGEDVIAGTPVLLAGTRLRAPEVGLLASLGVAKVAVSRRLRVALFSTGDELAMPGDVAPENLPPGAIYNSNRYTLKALLENLGCEVCDGGIIPDTLAATRQTLREAAKQCDLIISSGGVSVGEEDHVRPAVEAEGRLNVWQIAIKPGKPLAFGEVWRASSEGGARATHSLAAEGSTLAGSNSVSASDSGAMGGADRAFFLGLPGNPVSSLVTFLIFARPFILRLQGVQEVQAKGYLLRADFEWSKPDRRQEFLRVRLNERGGVERFANQGSAILTSAVWADGLVENPPGQAIMRGEMVRFLPFSELLY